MALALYSQIMKHIHDYSHNYDKFSSVIFEQEYTDTYEFITTTIYNESVINYFIEYIKKYKSFSPIDDSEKEYLKYGLILLNKQLKTNMTIDHLIYIRNIVISQLSKDYYNKVCKLSNKLLTHYDNGYTPLEIALKFNLPPIQVFKQIMYCKGISWKNINYMINYPNKQSIKMYHEINEVITNDHNSYLNMQLMAIQSEKYETEVNKYFIQLGIYFETEYELKLQQIEESNSGKPYATPDFYFPDSINIEVDGDSHIINWVDVKDYTLINIPLIIDSLEKQAAKYNKHFGKGAFMFSGGITKNITFTSDVIIIDGSFI